MNNTAKRWKEREAVPRRIGPRAKSVSASAAEPVRGMVEEYPLSAALASFGLGLAVGVMIANALSLEPRATWDRYIPESMVRRWWESFVGALPESVRERVA